MATTPTRTGKKAVEWAAAQVKKPSLNWNNLCLMFVRSCFGVAAKEPNAKKAWENSKYKHKETDSAKIPVGVPVFYKTKTVNWHVVISAGDGGMCYSSDVGGKGKIGRIGIQALAKAWGITLLGWTEDLNGVRVYTPPKPPDVPPFPLGIGPGKSKPSAKPLQKQLQKAGFFPRNVAFSDNYGPVTQASVARFHNKHTQFRSPGVKLDGRIGPKGWKFLFDNYG